MLDIVFDERSTGVMVCDFTDESKGEAIPSSIKWTLTTADGQTIINNKERVEVATPAASTEILLSGDDLQILESEAGEKYAVRKLTVEAEYFSDMGNNLPLNGEKTFKVKNLAYIRS